MRIGIDVRSLQNDSQFRGIGRYTSCLVNALLKQDKDDQYTFFAYKNQPLPDLFIEGHDFRKVTSKKKRFVWISGQLFFPRTLRDNKIDVFHSPEYIVPVLASCKKVITVHDFINYDYPFYKKRCRLIRRIYFYLKDKTLVQADGVIAVSEYTKKKILELTKVKAENIKVIYESADPGFKPISDKASSQELKKKYGIYDDFVLYVGAIDYHKNIEGLLRTFAMVEPQDISLVLIGVKNDLKFLAYIRKLILELNINKRVHILGYISQQDLLGFYNLAKITVSLSVYEGFGLPILEAMSCACPVIASNNTSLPEIVGDSGILVDPYDPQEAADRISRLLADESLRVAMAKKAFIRSKEFSWEKTALQTLHFYNEVLNKI
jgi:glycosyltransferase involved in cell wall biosynthesis